MKKIILLSSLLLSNALVFSQLNFGLKTGIGSNFGTNNIKNSKPGDYYLNTYASSMSNVLNSGVFARIGIHKYYIQPELLYQSGQVNYTMEFLDIRSQTVKFNKSANISTLDMPLLVGYKIKETKTTNFRVFAGPKLRFNTGSILSTTYFHTLGTTTSNDLQADITPVKIGLETGIGFEYLMFCIDISYNFIKDINLTKLSSKTIDKTQANAFIISLGLKLH